MSYNHKKMRIVHDTVLKGSPFNTIQPELLIVPTGEVIVDFLGRKYRVLEIKLKI